MSGLALVLHSGGQDSTTCLYWAKKNFDRVYAMSFYYGQLHKVELEMARATCEKEGIPWTHVDLSFISQLNDNALTNADVGIELQGDYKNLPSTFVPGRNIFFLSAAAAFCAPRSIEHIVTGVCQTDYSGYPDCRQPFVSRLNEALNLGLDSQLKIHTPLMNITKAQTFALAEELGCLSEVLEYSHTCYRGVRNERHSWGYGCASCPACDLRKKGFLDFLKMKERQHG